MIQDKIERQITIRAPKESVYSAITDPEKITSWFPDGINGTLEVGATPTLDFGEYGFEKIHVVAANPYDYFAYRWVPGNPDGANGFQGDILSVPNTLVEFCLKDDPNGTLLTLVESGFATLPELVAQKKFEENTDGWNYMLDRLEKLFAQK